MNIVMNNLISLCISWIVSWNGGIAESKGMYIFEAFDTHCQIAFRKPVLIESPSRRPGSPREPSSLLLSGDAAWVIHEAGGNSFSLSLLSLCFSFLPLCFLSWFSAKLPLVKGPPN